MASRPFITCHVLDTTTGRPASGIKVTLNIDSPTSTSLPTLHATTNSDGRVTSWTDTSPEALVEQAGATNHAKDGRLRWKLVFQTEAYYGVGKAFYPHVEVPFFTDLNTEKSHYHVPLLLGPWSYTTYRGS
ncbi:Hydroxyisourate hydrolase [Myriangium duriaei CBS 260.36]|uniref:5-hydroxyisourate hydrolase n=1 Tax=Myriangium duriaei CBS 260.36 TaxID=1168546 RepID=A0A9P4JD90_9PEZI|nr:Hydroxyisourate hydrolase [Myriangium duriaei CBS 260.36]